MVQLDHQSLHTPVHLSGPRMAWILRPSAVGWALVRGSWWVREYNAMQHLGLGNCPGIVRAGGLHRENGRSLTRGVGASKVEAGRDGLCNGRVVDGDSFYCRNLEYSDWWSSTGASMRSTSDRRMSPRRKFFILLSRQLS